MVGGASLIKSLVSKAHQTTFGKKLYKSPVGDYIEIGYRDILNATTGNPFYGSNGGEGPMLGEVISNISEGDVFYDIGAGYGLYTDWVSRYCDPEKIVAFEPDPKNFEILKDKYKDDESILVFPFALSDSRSEMELVLDYSDEQGSPSFMTNEKEGRIEEFNLGSTTVNTFPLDDLLREKELPHPNIVKIDVEGAELDVVRGMKESLSEPSLRLLYCEVHTATDVKGATTIFGFGGAPEELNDELSAIGFESEIILERKGDHQLKFYHTDK